MPATPLGSAGTQSWIRALVCSCRVGPGSEHFSQNNNTNSNLIQTEPAVSYQHLPERVGNWPTCVSTTEPLGVGGRGGVGPRLLGTGKAAEGQLREHAHCSGNVAAALAGKSRRTAQRWDAAGGVPQELASGAGAPPGPEPSAEDLALGICHNIEGTEVLLHSSHPPRSGCHYGSGPRGLCDVGGISAGSNLGLTSAVWP